MVVVVILCLLLATRDPKLTTLKDSICVIRINALIKISNHECIHLLILLTKNYAILPTNYQYCDRVDGTRCAFLIDWRCTHKQCAT